MSCLVFFLINLFSVEGTNRLLDKAQQFVSEKKIFNASTGQSPVGQPCLLIPTILSVSVFHAALTGQYLIKMHIVLMKTILECMHISNYQKILEVKKKIL